MCFLCCINSLKTFIGYTRTCVLELPEVSSDGKLNGCLEFFLFSYLSDRKTINGIRVK